MNFLNPFRTESAEVREPGKGSNPTFVADPIDRLPPPAADKLRSIRREASDAHAVLRPLQDELTELREKRQRSEVWIGSYINGRHDGRAHREDDPAIVREREKIAKLTAEIDRLQAAYDERAAKWRHLAAVRETLESYIKRLSDPVEAAPPVAATLGKGETHQQAVARVRKQLEKLREDAQAVADAPIHSSVAKQMARTKIEALAERGRPNTLISIEAGRPFEFPTVIAGGGAVAVEGKMVSLPFHRVTDTESMFCWLHRDSLIAAIEREIDENSDDASALSPETRAKKTAQCKSAILAAERDEESLIAAAQEAGLTIHRRPECDPRAVLGLSDTAPAPRDS
ncbi:hypothetical protein [Methylocystis sp. ATCC 49242]|uniref:hypothetical protein n=1 Tax=Methylocystis sp. ATCC 49242 TaxID=622637 RepID=UPI0001F88689|nr:hypothetical protein [Methylocystis sp. ATCC 49242]